MPVTAIHSRHIQEGGESVQLGPGPILGLGGAQVVTPSELETPLPLPPVKGCIFRNFRVFLDTVLNISN